MQHQRRSVSITNFGDVFELVKTGNNYTFNGVEVGNITLTDMMSSTDTTDLEEYNLLIKIYTPEESCLIINLSYCLTLYFVPEDYLFSVFEDLIVMLRRGEINRDLVMSVGQTYAFTLILDGKMVTLDGEEEYRDKLLSLINE